MDSWWRDTVRFAAEYRCERCGKTATDSHHVFTKKAHPGLRHLLCNGVGLCRQCHNAAHDHPVEFKAWFALNRSASLHEVLTYQRLGYTRPR